MRKYLVELYLLMFPAANPPSNKELIFGIVGILGVTLLAYCLLS